jgi:hypothetical protein
LKITKLPRYIFITIKSSLRSHITVLLVIARINIKDVYSTENGIDVNAKEVLILYIYICRS